MRRLWLSACLTLAAAAWLAVPAEAQKGKAGGKGSAKRSSTTSPPGRGGDAGQNRKGSGKGRNEARNDGRGNAGARPADAPAARSRADDLPSEPGSVEPRVERGNGNPARSFAHPKSGNTLPQEVRDRLPPGLRDKPADHPGLANHLRKMGLNEQGLSDPAPINSIPRDVRSQLPPGLRDRPYTHPGVANHLGKMGWGIGEDGTLIPPASTPLPPPPGALPSGTILPGDPLPPEVRRQLPATLRDRPYDDPGVANYLGRLGWSIAEDGELAAPPRYRPEVFPDFRPFGGFFRR